MQVLPRRKSFLVRMPERELFRIGESYHAAHRRGFQVTAFTPFGAALKLCRAGIISGCKNYEVIGEGVTYSLYPAPTSPLVALDDPKFAWAHISRALNSLT